jgi:disulfide bond formation protein DsbB
VTKNINIFLFLSWIVATVATLGSLFFSEIMQFVPCALCWYQRIAMYPLVILLGQGLLMQDGRASVRFALPIALIGWGFAMYHTLLHVGLLTEEMVPCAQGIPCSTRYIEWFGFISIPILSLMAFSLIVVGLLFYVRRVQR